jgi:endonuclease/exonuclease/phosphatase family metal-dependent hydrolase
VIEHWLELHRTGPNSVQASGLEVLGYEVPDGADVERASDHRPVLVTLRLP